MVLEIRLVELAFPLIEGQHTAGNGWAAIFGSQQPNVAWPARTCPIRLFVQLVLQEAHRATVVCEHSSG